MWIIKIEKSIDKKSKQSKNDGGRDIEKSRRFKEGEREKRKENVKRKQIRNERKREKNERDRDKYWILYHVTRHSDIVSN